MRILADLQACQSLPHRNRGIGRYALSLAAAISRQCSEKELCFVLNGAIPGTIEAIRAALRDTADYLVFQGLTRTAAEHPENEKRRAAGAIVRDVALASRAADIHHISSFFEGYADDVVVDVAETQAIPTAVTLYDLIPLRYQEIYLQDERMKRWYLSRVEALKHANILLAISECTRRDAIQYLEMDPSRVVNISAAVDPMFKPQRLDRNAEANLRANHRLDGRILLYTGGIDHRKNVERLIEAFSRIDPDARSDVQLVIVCGIDAGTKERLLSLGSKVGLAPGQLVLAGYVSDEDLVALYNICEAFVFPSWYEGFGLPVLEALTCGAAVVASERASVPEVVGRSDALFNPFHIDEMATKIAKVLTDSGFRRSLREHALTQAKQFSWEKTAERVIQAMAEAVKREQPNTAVVVDGGQERKPTLAYVSPVPPEQTGIAYYSSELLPHLSQHYRIVLVTDQARVDPSENWPEFEVRDVAWFEQHAGSFDRILYHFGNSAFHWQMFGLLERFGGVVVLHDFYLSGAVSHLQWASKAPGFWTEYLYRSHGYRALIDLASGADPQEMLLRYPCNAPVIDNADGIIVHSQHSCNLAEDFYGQGTSLDWFVIPILRSLPKSSDRARSRADLGIGDDEYVVCSFGILGDGKLNHSLLDAWQASSLAKEKRCRLVFVGGAHDPAYDAAIRKQIAKGPNPGKVAITGYVTPADYSRYLQVADAAVQLRRNSRGETSAALLDCLAHGVPTIVNAHGSAAELPSDTVVMLEDDFDVAVLSAELESLFIDPDRRARLMEAGVRYCRQNLDPQKTAAQYSHAIERAYASSPLNGLRKAGGRMGRTWHELEENDRRMIAEAMAANQPSRIAAKKMLVDVTELTRRDAKSGIQRVVRSIVSCLLKAPPANFRVEPVYADPGVGYRYARDFCCDFFGLPRLPLADELVVAGEGDIFIGLDLALEEIPASAHALQAMRDSGASVYVVVYDLLPLVRNECFPAHAEQLFRTWLSTLSAVGTGAICISRAVADELARELDGLEIERQRPLRVGYFHLGGDIEESLPSRGIGDAERAMVDELGGTLSFLLVGTIEPRKGHAQSLDAFELLWKKGRSERLIIVGKPGWMTEPLVSRIRNHPELGRRLQWLEGASDEALNILYERCSALLVASEGEGFGLPLIEAARHGLPIIARDLPVFREVAADWAYYFNGYEARQLETALEQWCEMYARGDAPSSSGLQWVTWKGSADMLVKAVTDREPYADWRPSMRRYVPMYDSRHDVQLGSRIRGVIALSGEPGFVVRTRPIGLSVGDYRLLLLGSLRGSGTLQVGISDQTMIITVYAEDASSPTAYRTYGSNQLLRLSADDRDTCVTIHSEGDVQGTIAALLFEPAVAANGHSVAEAHAALVLSCQAS